MDVKLAIKVLEKEYGIPKQESREEVLDSLIETILSQNTNDINRDRAFERLKSEFPTWDKVMNAPEKKIARAIRVGGLANIKSTRIKTILREIMRKNGCLSLDHLRNMGTEDAANELFSFKGVGEKTVKCVLLFSLGRNVFPVDTHIHRLCRRMGFVHKKASREETHRIMAQIVPDKKMYSFHINLIRHGRKICIARKPDCPSCPLRKLCPKII
jgi:endonuclease III